MNSVHNLFKKSQYNFFIETLSNVNSSLDYELNFLVWNLFAQKAQFIYKMTSRHLDFVFKFKNRNYLFCKLLKQKRQY